MTVWIVCLDRDGELIEVSAVFAAESAARAFCERYNTAGRIGHTYTMIRKDVIA